MKKTHLLFFLLFSTCLMFGQEKGNKESIFKAAVILGFNATQVDGDDLAGYRKFGVNAGGAAFILLPKNFSVNFEMLYSQKGSKKAGTTEQQQLIESPDKIVFDYVDVPVVFNYHDKDKAKEKDIAIFGLGVVFNSLVRYKVEYPYKTVNEDPYKRFGVEALANLTFVFAKKFGANLRFTYSLTNVAKVEIPESGLRDKGLRNNVVTLRLMYFI